MNPTPAKSGKPLPATEGLAARPPGGELAGISRDELQAFIHDLRNHLNALMMNAGVLATGCKDRERMARFIERVEQEGERCAEMLQGISDRHL